MTTMKNIFEQSVCDEVVVRIGNLTHETQPKWGKMSVGQMLAHVNVAYEMAYTDQHKRPNGFVRFMLKAFVKKTVVGEKPYKRNTRTAPAFLQTEPKDFEQEKGRLLEFIGKTRELGASHFEGKESNSFGKLSSKEWNIMFYKHLDHHLKQFGV